ncbi:esterase FE4-like isoform X2 [Planococcus citri]
MIMFVFLFACTLTSTYGYYPSVTVEEGTLLGTFHTTLNGSQVHAFLGIPYASPPVGDYRFKEPQRPKLWTGIREATSVGNQCLQTSFPANFTEDNHIKTIGDEDCLYLNVFTPKLASEINAEADFMNVLVYIHGGGFMFGTGNDVRPDRILQIDNIVFVTISYRLGALGFFAANDSAAPGNNGLKDQVAALQWIQRNIRKFGGDPAKVTVYGCSAGGASVNYLMISPTTEGLFQSAISSSGSILTPWSLQTENVMNRSKELVSLLNCRHKRVNTMMECLRNKSVNEIMDHAYRPYFADGYPMNVRWGAALEIPHHGAFLSKDPLALLEAGEVKHIPWMITMSENEGIAMGYDVVLNRTKMSAINQNWNKMMPNIFSYNNINSKHERDRISASIRKYYFKNKPLSNQTLGRYFQALTDRQFFNGIIESAKLYSAASLEDTYCYKLYYWELNAYPMFEKYYGCPHCGDVPYIVKYPFGTTDKDMTRLLTSNIVAFMKNG